LNKTLLKKNRGLSIIEMVVALALFSSVALVSLASMVSLIDANEKSRNTSVALDSVSYALEDILRNIRFGRNIYCELGTSFITISPSSTRNTCDYSTGGRNYIALENKDGYINFYKYDATAKCIQKKTTSIIWGSQTYSDDGTGYQCLTSSDIEITRFRFFVIDTNINTKTQRVVMVIQGVSGRQEKSKTTFNMMTSATTRSVPLD
jgi:prepilin-type N-terminal cleavage/methylation domain-containing protein